MNVLITGANRGLGYALAELGAERGFAIYAGVRRLERAQQLQDLNKRYAGRVQPVALDVTQESSIAAAANALRSQGVMLDAVVNNAAVLLGRSVQIEELELADLIDSFTANLFGPMMVIKHFLPLVAKGPQATLVNISSEAGSMAGAYGGDYPYALSKASLNYFSLQLKQYVKDAGVHVYAVHPGWIQTDMGGSAAPGDPNVSAKGILDVIERKIMIGHEAVFIDHNGQPMAL
ncbi:SDR family oxidoreductase [Paenibacillus sedimenti]|uniref:SDR family oxidoreductase n=1 Tax=Paenibacillus sedimenti TaxID=2770274 RepID=A0A926QL90_9BACL|nr:SDR family oxidoreductase [Paenibacillus sedimenti]MBD0383651.1 SDR family oxidoreductase [Paenibacillus sedimenti]